MISARALPVDLRSAETCSSLRWLSAGGMPDLLLWHPLKRKAKLSEVKGPRDRLSDQQRVWIAAITAAGLEVEVCKVQEPKSGAKA